MAFATFSSKSHRDIAMKILRDSLEQDDDIQIKADLRVGARARKTFLLGLRYLLKSWNFQNVRVDD